MGERFLTLGKGAGLINRAPINLNERDGAMGLSPGVSIVTHLAKRAKLSPVRPKCLRIFTVFYQFQKFLNIIKKGFLINSPTFFRKYSDENGSKNVPKRILLEII